MDNTEKMATLVTRHRTKKNKEKKHNTEQQQNVGHHSMYAKINK